VSRPALTPGTGSLSAGFFGKLPGRGDFIGRYLPRNFLEPWDGWLQGAMAYSRNQLAETWLDCYCTSPIWRFALSGGVCGPGSYAGVLMPSVDRVNRHYPLTIAAPLTPDWPLLTVPSAGTAWFQGAERIALDGLEQDTLDLEGFSRRVAELGALPVIAQTGDATVTGKVWHCSLSESQNWLNATPALASHLLQRAFARPSLWWTEGSDRIARCLLICEGLPPIEGFAALLAGDWRQRGWNEKPLADIAGLDEPSAAEEASS